MKQRLVGASVLIALAVVVLPMLLSGQPENQQEARSIEVPPRPSELSFETRRFPLGDQNGEQPSVVESSPSGPGDAIPADTEPNRDAPAPAGESETLADQDTQPPPVPAEDVQEPAEQPGRYLVQVASFSTTTNANRLAARLRDDGLSVMMDTIEAEVGTLHRVRVGPFDQMDGAVEAMAQIQAQTPDVKPRIIDLRPDESAPITDPADPLARWVVQVGSFSERDNAESLVGQLRAAGFNAYSVTVRDSAATRYKVRVGPEIERQSALRIAADIRAKLDLDGIVMTSD